MNRRLTLQQGYLRLPVDRTTIELILMEEASATYGVDTGSEALAVRAASGNVTVRHWAMRPI